MEGTILKMSASAAATALVVYFNQLLIPLVMLLLVMVCDYATGMIAAFVAGKLSSRTGIFGIVKKLCYFFAVVVGGGMDWLLQSALTQVGVEIPHAFTIAMLILIWLVINELLSILENLGEIGVPLPGFLKTAMERLKEKLEEQGEKP